MVRPLATPTAKEFAGFVESVSATAIMIWTKKNKSAVLDGIKRCLSSWKDESPPPPFRSLLKGDLTKCRIALQGAFSQRGMTCDAQSLKKLHWGGAPPDASLLWLVR
jgi:hypothetical protein